MDKMTKWYLERGGVRCPHCRSDNIESTGSFSGEGDYMTQQITCNNCNSTWKDEYTLTGISEFEAGDGVEVAKQG